MASRIAGITVEIGGDTIKLSKALEGVNKEIKNTQTQLKDVNKRSFRRQKFNAASFTKSDIQQSLSHTRTSNHLWQI